MEAFRTMKTKTEQVDEWMATKPVIRDIINGVLVETTGEDRRVRFEAAYDQSAPIFAAAELADSYNAARANLVTYWSSQPSWIRGPFDASYQSAVSLLDRDDIEAAIAIIAYAPIPSAYDADQVAAFENVRNALLAGLGSLPAKPK
jgi:hypothetical protein